ncbi:hypothetical protein [Marinobacterium lutimaris]|uniref:DUF4376 domain-containing protein n=1 Tax=Marinobacterium lutimaris TaxID=568106 RepID=A0A1H5XSR8_9GAMM|nr:hypothetical protein [Marinobacterium lutimaris]SEG14296.1 hypothetical protein SAMN05444390_1011478 [Marinobacterium lutimaris]
MDQYKNEEFTGTFNQVRDIYLKGAVSLPREHPENWPKGPWEKVTVENKPLTVEQVLQLHQEQVRNDAEASYRESVTFGDGSAWNGGFDSAMAINGEVQLQEFDGATTVTLFDINNDPHTLTLAEGKAVAAAVGAQYRIRFAAKQSAMRALADVDLTATDAIEQLNAIEFANYLPAVDPEAA